ncbi:Endoplasmic reticulum resident protein 29, C-terminal [Dillenia turbinata]|uniref:Endoplasmic reticulum resident protein 29, C-terminal n=1 Tax=Dillenia turbinata TaxID=194707 RepID=A0AAN8ZKC9_9MAGN
MEKGQLTSKVSALLIEPCVLLVFLIKHSLFVYAAIIESLDAMVKEFANASSEEKKTAVSKKEEEVEKFKGASARYGKIYLKASKSSVEKGSD